MSWNDGINNYVSTTVNETSDNVLILDMVNGAGPAAAQGTITTDGLGAVVTGQDSGAPVVDVINFVTDDGTAIPVAAYWDEGGTTLTLWFSRPITIQGMSHVIGLWDGTDMWGNNSTGGQDEIYSAAWEMASQGADTSTPGTYSTTDNEIQDGVTGNPVNLDHQVYTPV